jgi:RNA polymerase sigma factor for flagellar operon FliA
VQRAAVLSLNAIVGDNDVDLATGLASHEVSQEDQVLAQERTRTLQAAVEALPERLRIVIQGYFLGERPMAEIARELGVSESRISQMRAQALELLREGMTRALEPAEIGAAPEQAPRPVPGVAARRREEYYSRVAAMASTSGRRDAVQAAHSTSATHADAPSHPAYLSALA